MFVARLPTNCGRESHTNADYDTGCIIFVEPYEGKERMTHGEFCKDYGKNPAEAMQCKKQWFNSVRTAIDNESASVHLASGFAEHGMYKKSGNVKNRHSKFPRQWLRSKATERGQCASCT
jgi:hypothetical protein